MSSHTSEEVSLPDAEVVKPAAKKQSGRKKQDLAMYALKLSKESEQLDQEILVCEDAGEIKKKRAQK